MILSPIGWSCVDIHFWLFSIVTDPLDCIALVKDNLSSKNWFGYLLGMILLLRWRN
jgi:hypothetical protein